MSTGARALSLGNASAAINQDVSSIYTNPAALAVASNWQIASMSGKLLDEYNYISLSGVYPTKNGNFGIGIVSSNIGNAIPTKADSASTPGSVVYVEDPSLSNMNYYNNLLVLSYSNKLEQILSWHPLKTATASQPWLKELNWGTNLKVSTVAMEGGGLSDVAGLGTELDFGVQGATAIKGIQFGGALRNALPASLGGKIRYSSGFEEVYPAVAKIGLMADILGGDEAINSFNGQKVKLLTDVEFNPGKANSPILYKLGIEWTPIDLISVRAGLDQASVGTEIANNLAAGLGINYNGFRFDYAYHQFEGAPGVGNHFFTINYTGITKASTPVNIKSFVKISTPQETSITTEKIIDVKGLMSDDIGSISVNSIWAKTNKNGSFEARVPLAIGKNGITIEAFNKKGMLVEEKIYKVLRLNSYPDVQKNHWAYEQINQVSTVGLIKGYSNGKFKPEGKITRAELSALLARAMKNSEEIPNNKISFKDVSRKFWASEFIAKAVNTQIAKGYSDGTFKPNADVSRAEGLKMIAKFGGVEEEEYSERLFSDISSKHWVSKIIAGAHKEGMLSFLRGRPFNPNLKLTRAEAVELISKTKIGKDITAELLDFSKDYASSTVLSSSH